MNIVVLQENINTALSKTSKFLPSKTSVVSPINNFLLSAEKGKIILQATDLETTFKTTIPGKIVEEGVLVLPAKPSLSLFSLFTGEKLSLLEKQNTLVIQGEASKAVLKLERSESYPKTEEGKEQEKIDLRKEDINRIVSLNSFSVSSDISRAVLTGVLLSLRDKQLTTVSTDGFRLSVCQTNKVLYEGKIDVVVPNKAIRAMSELTEKGSVSLQYDKKNQQISASGSADTVVTRLIDGSFPQYEKIIPSGFQTKIVVDRLEALRAIKLASVFARESANIVKIKISKKEIVISSRAAQTGENTSTLPIDKTGEDLETAFNYRFLIDVLSALSSDTVTFESNGPLQAGVFYGEKKEEFFHIIMPVRLQESK